MLLSGEKRHVRTVGDTTPAGGAVVHGASCSMIWRLESAKQWQKTQYHMVELGCTAVNEMSGIVANILRISDGGQAPSHLN